GLLLMFLVAVNYQNSMAFALVFLLFGVLVVSILHTYGNLAGLTLEGLHGHPTFAGEQAEFELRLSHTGRRDRHQVMLGWPQQPRTTLSLVGSRVAVARLFH